MKGNPEIIEALNGLLKGEITATNQYLLHSGMCESWGYQRLAQKLAAERDGELKHAQRYVDRILFLDGAPRVGEGEQVQSPKDLRELLKHDLQLELDTVTRLKRAIGLCLERTDTGSRDLLERIQVDEEDHINWIEAQLHLIEEVGYQNYCAQQIVK